MSSLIPSSRTSARTSSGGQDGSSSRRVAWADRRYGGHRTAPRSCRPAAVGHTICNMLHRAVILVAFVALACAAAPGATRMPTIAPGVIVSGVYVGDLTSEPARDQLATEFARPLRVVYGDQHWVAYPQQLGGGATIDRPSRRRSMPRPEQRSRWTCAGRARRSTASSRRSRDEIDEPASMRRSRASARPARSSASSRTASRSTRRCCGGRSSASSEQSLRTRVARAHAAGRRRRGRAPTSGR